MRQVPLPKKGCFTSSYPSTEWREVPCATPPARPYPPARGPLPLTVGNGNDVSAEVTGHISTAVGSFDSVTGVTSETGQVNGAGGQVANIFSLQLNTNFFSGSPTCNGAANPSTCLAWEQFVYSNGESGSFSGFAFIQYWLIHYNTTCPSGWNTFTAGSETYCWMNSTDGVSVPNQVIANLGNLSVTGQAISGGSDAIIVGTGSNLYSAQGPDSVLVLAQGWQEAEFNIVGDCCGSQANFNSGSTIVVRTSVDSGTLSAPSCDGQGFTGETNNLSFGGAPSAEPGSLPAVVFTESSAGGAPSACASANTVGSSAVLHDFVDFSSDNKSDVLWRDTTGKLVIWRMNGVQAPTFVNAGSATTDWQVVGNGDFDGDSKPDILWRNDTSHQVAVWLMNGAQKTMSKVIGSATSDWTVGGTGDFDGDHKVDVLWHQTSTGKVAIWKMNGAQAPTFLNAGSATTDWQVAGVGDFDGDGMADILWRNTTGQVAVWLMSGAHRNASKVVGSATSDWKIVGIGNFDADNKADILWYQTSTGKVVIWKMNGVQAPSFLNAGFAPTVWQVAGTGDFDADGINDILWRNSGNGQIAVWLMDNAGQRTMAKTVGTATTDWQIQP